MKLLITNWTNPKAYIKLVEKNAFGFQKQCKTQKFKSIDEESDSHKSMVWLLFLHTQPKKAHIKSEVHKKTEIYCL